MNWKYVKCCLGLHDWDVFVDNLNTNTDNTITIGLKQCPVCGKSELLFIYGN